jgi:uncharacterized protein
MIAGVTTRALAVSAARAGYQVTAIDAFGDRDLRAVADVIVAPRSPGQRYSPLGAAAAGAHVPANAVAYTSNFENYPAAVGSLARARELLGNPPQILERVRDPQELSRTLRRLGYPAPLVRLRPPPVPQRERGWLLKPRRSGGGHGVQKWHQGFPIPRSMYLQERISGPAGSIIFASAGKQAVVLGLSRQLVGETSLGARGFRYCGNLLAGSAALFPHQAELLERAAELATVLTREFDLRGLNGIDFIARAGVPYPIEVNPRFSGSMELLERRCGMSMFEVHAAACRGRLPAPRTPAGTVQGKAVVFARRTLRIVDSSFWRLGRNLADLPQPGEWIQRDRPICTAFAEARTGASCRARLLRMAAAVYRATGQPLRRAS